MINEPKFISLLQRDKVFVDRPPGNYLIYCIDKGTGVDNVSYLCPRQTHKYGHFSGKHINPVRIYTYTN